MVFCKYHFRRISRTLDTFDVLLLFSLRRLEPQRVPINQLD